MCLLALCKHGETETGVGGCLGHLANGVISYGLHCWKAVVPCGERWPGLPQGGQTLSSGLQFVSSNQCSTPYPLIKLGLIASSQGSQGTDWGHDAQTVNLCKVSSRDELNED